MRDTMNYAFSLVALLFLAVYFVVRRQSTIWNIRGPTSQSWIFGNMRELVIPPSYGDNEFAWQKLYGAVYRLKGCFGQDRLMVSDAGALQYILKSPHFALSVTLQNMVGLVFGHQSFMGIRGDIHKRIRNEFNIGFTAAAVRSYQPIFEKVAYTITQELESADSGTINVLPLLGAATLSAIAEAAFSYSIEDLGEDYVAANVQIMAAASSQSAGQIVADAIGAHLPAWLLRAAMYLPTRTFKTIRTAKYLGNRLAERVVRGKEELASQGLDINHDIFGLLLDPNRLDKTRSTLTGQDIVDQSAIIMLGGQDTTANTVAFALLELARNPEFQGLLRAEIHSTVGGADNGNVVYDRMPLLNALIKEALRVYPAEAFTERMALQDTIIPLSESIVASTGDHLSQIPVAKGQIVVVAIASYQRLQSRWGEDADKFRPSRWLDSTVSKGDAIGPYANLLTFLGGPHTCLGWRFALLEMQVVFCELVGKFSFALPENDPIRVRTANSLVPTTSNGQKGVPLRVSRIV
ncbi:cytochrome P450 [Mycena capillaripes]|nr:cytochrome P450 [Mycena capillaripes]